MRFLVPMLLLAVGCKSQPAAPLRVAAASDLTQAFEAIAPAFEKKTGQKVELVFGASGQLSKQLVEGAPYDLFAAANEAFTQAPIDQGVCRGDTRAHYAEGHLVIYAAKEKLSSLEDLKDPRFVKVAIANPEVAPYGKAAKDALMKAGLWEAIEPKLVYGQNIQQTFQLAKSGNAEAALVSRSLAKDAVEIDTALYTPLKQALVVCTGGKNTAGGEAFAAFVLSEEGRSILKSFGFALPSAAAL